MIKTESNKDRKYYFVKKGKATIRWVFPRSDKELLINLVEKVRYRLGFMPLFCHVNKLSNEDEDDVKKMVDKWLDELKEIKKIAERNFDTFYDMLEHANPYYLDILTIMKDGETYIAELHNNTDDEGDDEE